MKRNDVLSVKTLAFSIRIVRLYQNLVNDKKEFVLGKQLLRSGTNPGAMVREASDAQSGLDFIHKLSIAQKEIGETQYWLELLNATDYLSDSEYKSINTDAEEIMRILTSSIITKKKNLSLPK
jgi:four helix bundle protein